MSTTARDDIAAFITSYLSNRGALPSDEVQRRTFDYFDQGLVDSHGLMRLVAACEEHLDVELSDDAIMSDAFRTVGGLIDALHAACAAEQAA